MEAERRLDHSGVCRALCWAQHIALLYKTTDLLTFYFKGLMTIDWPGRGEEI